jgi:hypothetical protein
MGRPSDHCPTICSVRLTLFQQRQGRDTILRGAVYTESVRDVAAWPVTDEFLQRGARDIARRQVRCESMPRGVEPAPADRPQNGLEHDGERVLST